MKEIVLLVIGFVMLMKGADWFVEGASKLAARFGIPQLVIGLTIVAMGTSLPEAAVSILATVEGTAGIAIGNVIGSNIFNILAILGVTAMLRTLPVAASTIRYEMPFMIAVTILLLPMGYLGGEVSRWDGVLYLMLFVLYLFYLGLLSRKNSNPRECEKTRWSIGKCLLYLLAGGALVLFGSRFTVNAACGIARFLGMSERFIGLTIVACGTSLPELVTSVAAARKNQVDIAIGNIVGSNIFNLLFVIGTSSCIRAIPFEMAFIPDILWAIGVSVSLWIAVLPKKELHRLCCIPFLGAYVIYLCLLV